MAIFAKGGVSRRTVLGGGSMALVAGGSALALHSTPRMQRLATADAFTLNRGNGAEPNTLDPHLSVTSWENNIIGDLFMGLMTEDAAARPVPGAARSYTVSDDGLTYRFRMRPHTWSDGVPVTAEDFVYSLRRVMAPATAAQYASILYPIKNAEAVNAGALPVDALGVRAPDPETLEIEFRFQVPYAAQLMTHSASFPVPRHVVEKYGADWTQPGHIVSNGPYNLVEWVANDHITLTRNRRFVEAKPVPIKTVNFYPTPDAAAALKRFRGGEFDILSNSVAPQQTQWLKREVPRELHLTPFMETKYLVFNFERPPFDDLRVRKALSMAIDREILVSKITRGGETAAYSLVPPQMPGYPGQPHLRFRDQAMTARKTAAIELLREAGYGPNNPLDFALNLMMTTESKVVGVTMQEMWREIGVRPELIFSEGKVHYDLLRQQDFTIAWCAWSADYLDAKDFLFLAASTTKDLNFGRYRNPVFDRLLQQSDSEHDPALRAEMLEHAEQRMLDDEALAPVYYGVTRDLVSTEVHGWIDNPVDINRTRYLTLRRAMSTA